MIKKYLFVFDLDDTLLDDKKRIHFRDVIFIKKLLKQGHEVILASGRPVRGMIKYYKKLGLHSPLIGHNGALIYHPLDSNFPNNFYPFSKEDIFNILDEIKCNNEECYCNAICETIDTVYMLDDKKYDDKFLNFCQTKKVIGDFKEKLNENPQSFLIDMGKENYNMDKISSIICAQNNMKARFWGRPLKSFIEVYYSNLSKASALDYILEKNPSLKDYTIVSFGDSDNDYPMLDMAGEFGFIMKNSKHKNETNYKQTVDINNKSGVVKTIKQILKNSQL